MTSRMRKNKTGSAICDVCKQPHILEVHHIFGRNVANFNFDWNLIDICPNCHTEIHQNKIKVIGWENSTEGKKLIWHQNTISK